MKLNLLVEGVENLKTENETGTLTITGNVDPAKLRDKLAHKMKKNVQLISPISKNKDKENKPKPNNDDKKPKEVHLLLFIYFFLVFYFLIFHFL